MKIREKAPAGKPHTVFMPAEACVNWPMYWISWLNTSMPAVIGRSNRNGSVNPTW
jgi:hypothetical protein